MAEQLAGEVLREPDRGMMRDQWPFMTSQRFTLFLEKMKQEKEVQYKAQQQDIKPEKTAKMNFHIWKNREALFLSY